VLHVVRWHADALDKVLDDILSNGTALTLGIHSRIETMIARVTARMPNGNIYVNRNMIGAVVGSQPFGGTGLSGTGPKAGGPNYLHRLTIEQVVTVNTAASGGNVTLLSEEE
jgi:RHH-type proline utilization regulon transcriptional repressor/proline dehydrogenase/delta 1-pyrroline-5-carboxylate dehydrogenase